MFNNILIILMIVGLVCAVVSLTKELSTQPEQIIEYKYIPRTFQEEQDNPVYVSDIFKDMFDKPSPWVASINNIDYQKKQEINNFFISQA
jgi:hypothetical protein